MYDLRQNNMYEKVSNRITRANDGYMFETATPNTGIYARSPNYIGAKMWNALPVHIQNSISKEQFKYELRTHWT